MASTATVSWRVSALARLFTFLVAAVPALWYRETFSLLGLFLVAAVWAGAVALDRREVPLPILLEATVVGLVAGLALQNSDIILVILVAPPFVAAVRGGARALLPVLTVEVVLVVGLGLTMVEALTPERAFALTTWLLGALGLGLVGSFIQSTARPSVDDEVTPYRDAQRLLRQLLDLSDDLSSGLDVNSLGGVVVSEVDDQLPTSRLAVYVPREEVLVPLMAKGIKDEEDPRDLELLAVESWARGAPLVDDDDFAFPLGQKVVIAGSVEDSAGLSRLEVEQRIVQLMRSLRLPSVQLDTAMMFADFRASATADLRRRLAREMHDGIAQDIASLGYIVDALAAQASTPAQEKAFAMLRERITTVVAEVRQSVLTLRTSIGEAESLGAAISTVARHLSESSRIPIRVKLDEHSTRLRSEVEAELFRIAQEAMNNAIKHAEATQIEVHCQVYAPNAVITVTDDGRGLQPARSDSHGLKIMRERARLVGADLDISPNPSGGLVVRAIIDTTRETAPDSPVTVASMTEKVSR